MSDESRRRKRAEEKATRKLHVASESRHMSDHEKDQFLKRKTRQLLRRTP